MPHPKPILSKRLLDGAKPHEVNWEALAAISLDGYERGCESWVYFITEGDEGPVKIGVAKNPVTRRRQMQTGNPRLLRIERCIYGDLITEKLIHKAFSQDLVDRTGEWFSAREQILEVAGQIAEQQVEYGALNATMADMTKFAVEAIGELGREIIYGDDSRLPAQGGGYIVKRGKPIRR